MSELCPLCGEDHGPQSITVMLARDEACALLDGMPSDPDDYGDFGEPKESYPGYRAIVKLREALGHD